MSFKTFLLESKDGFFIKEKPITNIVSLLKRDGNAILNVLKDDDYWRRILFRGFSKDMLQTNYSEIYVDKPRLSRDSNNLYQLLMDNSESLKKAGIASRSKSIICSTSKFEAENYGKVYAILPFDETEITVSSVRDFLFSGIESLNVYSLYTFSEAFSEILEYFGAVQKRDERIVFTDIQKIDDALAKVENISHSIKDVLNSQKVHSDSAVIRSILVALSKMPRETRCSSLASKIMTTENLGLSKTRFGYIMPEKREVWFEGKAIAVKISYLESFRNMVNSLDIT